MAPPPPQTEFVEVRCAGCGETLEVERGLTEFACPDCGTQQALPPELMPPPRPRRALPIPGRGSSAAVPVPVPVPAPAPAHMPCGGCGSLLSVPAGLGRFPCPLCRVELVVDGGRLRLYLASPAAATVSVVALPPAGVALTSPYTHQQPEAQAQNYDNPMHSEQTPAQCPSQSVHREEKSSSFRKDTRVTIYSRLAQKVPPGHSVQREKSHIEPLNKTAVRSSTRNSRLQAGTESIGPQKVPPEPSIQESSGAQALDLPPSYSVRRDHTQGHHLDIAKHLQQTNDVSSIMEHEKIDHLNQAMNVEPAQAEDQCNRFGWNSKRKRRNKSTSGYQNRKNKGLTRSPNAGLPVRRSKRLTKQTEHPIDDEPAQQTAASPNAYNSVLPDIDRIIANLCPSSLHPHQMPQASSSESDNVDAAILPALSNHGISQPEQLPPCYSQLYPAEVRGTRQLDKSGEQVKRQSPEVLRQVMHVQESAHGGHLFLGSDKKSSGKRNGRRATRLIEPRMEVDRPVLIPNNIDNWDVSPPCPKAASTISILMKQKYPGSTYLPVDQHCDVPPNGEVVHHWHQYPPETRAAILYEFLQRYKWAPGKEAECLKLFERRAVRQFAGLLCEEKRRVRAELASLQKAKETSGIHRSNRHTRSDEEDTREEPEDQQRTEKSEDENPLKWKPFPPAWMYPNWWEKLCEHWAKEEVLMMSLQNRKNRFTAGRAHHTTGSRSIAMHRQLMVMENGGKLVSELEVFNKTHKLNGGTGEFISEKAKRTVEGFKKRIEEAGDKQIDPHLAWAQEVGGRSHGRYYGLTGIIDKAKIDELAKSMPGCFGKRGQQQKFSQEQVQQMINQSLQGLNETWESKFKSLEQSMRGAPLVGVDPEYSPGSSAAGGDIQEHPSTHQDASHSQHGEGRQPARHEDDDEEAEVVSTSD
ncbi:uncharacterized protein LOC100830790 isoform X2 [Brachypodium distachyon]|uniref:Uncharacterized protein n=1 Tax=Brachypodium distachyon TaxID=15368 RepID=A0A0Q3KWF0_BRADI|nr:uncharacterized protein LOC100830790 isoform X2 [Brachypodium distachyon]KQJ84493.1 hypothetical protein BRADI_5g21215v3 [Brachypodium distachyon]|eukprot:XP_010240392.1 uncharacterized protein LOC100830790 isoform X2 [Brachypodium distachyon]